MRPGDAIPVEYPTVLDSVMACWASSHHCHSPAAPLLSPVPCALTLPPRRLDSQEEGAGTFRYFLKVVPTVYSSLTGPEIPTNQFSVTEYFTPSKGTDGALPAVYFMYAPQFNPCAVQAKSNRHLLNQQHSRLLHLSR
jgi:hypothetical protein